MRCVIDTRQLLWFILILKIAPHTISFQPSFLPHTRCKVTINSHHPSNQKTSPNTRLGFYRGQTTTPIIIRKTQLEESAEASATVRNDGSSSVKSSNAKIDKILYNLTSLFPFFVMSAAILATCRPATLAWVNKGPTITAMLASVMVGMGMTLSKKDFDMVFQSNQIRSVPMGVLCQFGIMPLSAFLIGKYIMKLNTINPSLYLGLILVGSSPGGTASNLVSLIANADVALSVVLTSCSTMLASIVTPLLVKMLMAAGETAASSSTNTVISISGWALCIATAKVVLAPILIGMTLNSKVPKLCQWVSRFTPFASVLLVSLICGGVVAQNAASVTMTTVAGSASFFKVAFVSVFLLHSIGFAAGYILPRTLFKCDERTSRTVSIETGMQNSALACVLARSISADPLMSLPGALSATMHSCLGSVLAAYWRARDDKKE